MPCRQVGLSVMHIQIVNHLHSLDWNTMLGLWPNADLYHLKPVN